MDEKCQYMRETTNFQRKRDTLITFYSDSAFSDILFPLRETNAYYTELYQPPANRIYVFGEFKRIKISYLNSNF